MIPKTVFSPDRVYRYTLWRVFWDSDLFVHRNTVPRFVQFIGLNPSTADETHNDPTVTRCINYAQAWGYEAMCMTNLFAFRATDPSVMKRHPEPVGLDNDSWLIEIASQASLVIAAWGRDGRHQDRAAHVLKSIPPLHCLGQNKDSSPKHPLYLKSSLTPIRFPSATQQDTRSP